jgi:methionyl-tRNA formyltransferase
VVSSLGRYIPWKILKPFPPSRRLNVHPSLIPKYRGAAPIQWTIADGLKETGVSIIEVEKVGLGYDVGDIWAQKKISVPEGSTYTFLMPLLANEGSDLLVQVLRNMINETVSSRSLSSTRGCS